MTMNRLPKREEGSIFIWCAAGLAVLIAFAGLATDIPYLYVARHQAQTAADAGALAGAYELPNGGKARNLAKQFAGQTPIIGQLLTTTQVDAFTCNSNNGAIGECLANSADPDQVTCITYRDVAHGNPMPLFLMPILKLFGLGPATATSSGWDAANVSATATARISINTCGCDCMKPWSLADRWNDVNGNGTFDPEVDLYIPDGEIGPSGEPPSGYSYPADNGLQLTLKVGNPQAVITSGFFYAIDFPPLNSGGPAPITGGSVYRENISGCGEWSSVLVGYQLQVEPGNMQGPTTQGAQELIDSDPTAFWDTSCGCVYSPQGITSPRMIRMALFDPRLPVVPGRNFVTTIKLAGFFLESVQSNGDIIGRFTLVSCPGGAPNPECQQLFVQTVQLVK